MTEKELSKGEKLIWELFLFVRDLVPATEDNTRRLTEWARTFHGMHDPAAEAAPEGATEPSDHPAGARAKRR